LKSESSDVAHRRAYHLGVAGALLVGGNRADERLVLRGEEVGRRAENLRRPAAEHDVLRLDVELLGDQLDQQPAAAVVVPAGRPAFRAERGAHGVEHRLPGTDGVLVAGQADDARLDGLECRLERRPDGVFASARSDVGARQRAGRADAD
jgi:hypothetical protein